MAHKSAPAIRCRGELLPIVLSLISSLLYIFFCYGIQSLHQVFYLWSCKLSSVIRRHGVLVAVTNAFNGRLGEKKERAIARQQLDGKIIFVSGDPFQSLAVGKCDNHGPVARIKVPVGKQDGIADCFGSPPSRVGGEIRSEKSALTADHVTSRAPAFTEKELLTAPCASRQRRRCRRALQAPQVSHQRTKDIVAKVAEAGHGSLRDTFLQNLQKLRVRELADVRTRDNVGSAFAALSVQAMTAGAVGGEGLFRGGRICTGPWRRG